MKSNYYLERIGTNYGVRLNEGINTIGRAFDSKVIISGTFGSRNHCRIIIQGDNVTLEDFSSNGTFVNEVEYKRSTVGLRENDKIGIGVYSVDTFLENSDVYHVYYLRKIVDINIFSEDNVINKTNNKAPIIEVFDSGNESSDNEVEILCESGVEFTKTKSALNSTSDQNISNIGKKASDLKVDEEKINSNQNYKQKVDKNNMISKIDTSNNKDKSAEVGQSSSSHFKAEINNISLNKQKQDKSEKSEKEIENDFLDLQSDQLSQAVWDDIKQEIAELELDLSEFHTSDEDVSNNVPVEDILDLTLDDNALKHEEEDEDFDFTTKKWFMKLSQNFDESHENTSKSIILDTKNLTDQISNESVLEQKGSLEQASLSVKNNKISATNTIRDLSKERSSTKNDLCDPVTKKRRTSVLIIDAPSLPPRRGRHGAVSADLVKSSACSIKTNKSRSNSKNKSPKKNLRSHYSNSDVQISKLHKKWLEKPNAAEEKIKKNKIKDERKEKLKQIADQNSSSYGVRLNEGINTIGRAFDSKVIISGTFGSRNHCRIIIQGDNVTLEDFSSNGTFVNEVEYKRSTVGLQENDKIGIGVYSVDTFLENSDVYHVYYLRKIVDINIFSEDNVINKTNNKAPIIEVFDSGNESSDNEVEILCESGVEFTKTKSALNSTSDQNISNIGKKASDLKVDEEKINSNQNYKRKVDKNNMISKIDTSNNKDKSAEVGQSSSSHFKAEINNISLNKQKQDKSEKSEKEIENDFLDLQSDQLSQAVWDDIKQEIAELELDLSEFHTSDEDVSNNVPVEDILDLTLDDNALKHEEEDEDFDFTTKKWFMKLSQNFDESHENTSKSIILDTKNLTDQISNESVLEQKGSLEQASLSVKNNKISATNTIRDLSKERSSTKNDLCDPVTKKRRTSVLIIDAPSLPPRRGRHGAVSADLVKSSACSIKTNKSRSNSKNKSPKKNLRSHYSNSDVQISKLHKKWLEKPNAAEEKIKKNKIKDERKEKLKQIADQNSSSYGVRLNEGINTIGRAFDSKVIISGTFGSRNHCRIIIQGDKVTLEDFSSNGTFVNEVEYKRSTVGLQENDKIGIGVYSVDTFLENSDVYHVYYLRKIVDINIFSEDNVINKTNNKAPIIEVFDSGNESSDNEVEILCESGVEFTKTKSALNSTSDQNISNIGKKASDLKVDEEKINSNQNYKQKVDKNNMISKIDTSNNKDKSAEVGQSSSSHFKAEINNISLNKQKQDKSEKSEKEIENDFLDLQSDQLSQAVWDDIKQEIAELELDLSEFHTSDDDVSNNVPVEDILDLTLDDNALKHEEEDEDFDFTTKKWFMKLSQNFDESHENTSKSIILDTKNLTDQISNESVLEQKGSLEQASLSVKNNKISATNTIRDLSKERSSTKNDLCDPVTKKRRTSVLIIDAPSLPPRRGRHGAVSADLVKSSACSIKTNKSPSNSKNKSPKKNLRSHYSNPDVQISKLHKKWLEKPNAAKEKIKKNKIKDERKEKLKQIAEKNCAKETFKDVEKINQTLGLKKTEKRKLSIAIDDLEDSQRKEIIKKAKVKITNKNRGAFLTELSKDSTTKNSNNSKSTDVTDTSIKRNSFNSGNVIVNSTITKNKEHSEEKHAANNKKTENFKDFKIPKSCVKNKQLVTLKSSLKSFDNIISKDKKTKKSVKFNLKPIIHNFEIELEIEESSDQNILKQVNNKNVMKPDLSHFEGRKRMWRLKSPQISDSNIDDILTDILSWKPIWFDEQNVNIYSSDVLCPMIHSFKSFENYKKIIFPLMKLELWERLVKDRKNYCEKFEKIVLKKFQIEEKIPAKRIVCNCEYTNSCPLNKPIFYTSELVLLKFPNKKVVFGYVRFNRCLNPNSSNSFKTYNIEIEMNFLSDISVELENFKIINVQKISVIATELGAFEAVKKLCYSPLLNNILNPILLTQNNELFPEDNFKKFKYNGYDKLNEVQKNVLMKTYLRTINPLKDNITLIEGPPGTGKSKLITNLILQLQYGLELRQLDRKILVCAQSNTAVDVITQKLIKIRQKMDSKKFRLVRYGVLDKMHSEVKPYSLSELIKLQKRQTIKNSNIVGLMEEKNLLEQQIKKLENTKNVNSRDSSDLDKKKKDLSQIKNLLEQNFNKIDRDLEYKFLAHANIVCTTLSSCVRLLRYCNFFDVCIVDEATQCNEPWVLVPLEFGISSLILIGDTQQLPATTLSHLSKSYNFGKSYFTRVKELVEDSNKSTVLSLRTQYRMHPEIAKWPNSYFYKNNLLNGAVTTNFKCLVKPYSVMELSFNQNKISATGKIENCSEADFVVKLVKGLVDIMPTKQFSYGIITPYNLHCQNLREKMRKESLEIEVNTIDSFQGKEKDVIIISNARTEGIGFLNEVCRLNVALTRAKKCLILCGNFQQLTNINVWKSLLADAKRRNNYYEPKESDLNDFKKKILEQILL